MRSSLSLVELDYIFQYQKEDSFYQERFDYLFSFCCRVNSFQKFNLIIKMIKARLFQIKSLNSSSFTSCSLCARHFDLEFYNQYFFNELNSALFYFYHIEIFKNIINFHFPLKFHQFMLMLKTSHFKDLNFL